MNQLICLVFILVSIKANILLPIDIKNRKDISMVKLTKIGDFGIVRKSRVGVPEHLHTGVDIQRPDNNYKDEPIYSIASGVVVSICSNGPYANIIIEHHLNSTICWSLYEHVSGINVKIHDKVTPHSQIARFMNQSELDKYGWQFDHFHLEVLKVKPMPLSPTPNHPYRFYKSYSLICFSDKELNKYYYNPIQFLKSNF